MLYPITAIIGDRGAGKTCIMTALAEAYHKEGKRIFTNYHLFHIPYTKITLEEMIKLPDHLNNSVVLIDEIHVWADAYDFMGKPARALATFATQLRKRKVNFYYTTQIFTQAPLRLRRQTNYFMAMQNTAKQGQFKTQIIDRFNSNTIVNEFYFDGRPFYDKYDTDEVIVVDEKDEN